MKLTLRTLTAMAFCLFTSLAIADKHHDCKQEEGDGIRRKKIEVTTTADHGRGSLRCAIEKANNLDCPAHIVFDLKKSDCNYNPETETWVIRPQTDLPEVTVPFLWIDFLSQKGSRPNCNPVDKPNCARLKIEIEGPGFDETAPVFAAQAAVIPAIRGLQFSLDATDGLVTGANITRFLAGVVTNAPRTTVAQAHLGIANGVVKPVLTGVLAEQTATNVVLRNIHAVGFGRLNSVLDDSKAAIPPVIFGGDLGGFATIRSRGALAELIHAGINIAGTTQAHPNLRVGLVLNIADNAPAASAVTAEDLILRNAVLSGHTFANAAFFAADRATVDGVAFGTNIRRTANITPLNQPNVASATVTLVSLHGLLLLNQRPVPGANASAAQIFNPRGFYQIIRTTAGGNFSGITSGFVLLPGVTTTAAPEVFFDVVDTVHITDSFLGHTGTSVISNNTGHTSTKTVNSTIQRTILAANLLHGSHFLPNLLSDVAAPAIFPIQLIRHLDNPIGTTATGLAAGNGGSGVQIEVLTAQPAVFQNNHTSFNQTGYAFVCGTPVRTSPTDNVINNRVFNVAVCI